MSTRKNIRFQGLESVNIVSSQTSLPPPPFHNPNEGPQGEGGEERELRDDASSERLSSKRFSGNILSLKMNEGGT